ncbi:hypothetical protein S245_043442, partial [Arachis hypogaea]
VPPVFPLASTQARAISSRVMLLFHVRSIPVQHALCRVPEKARKKPLLGVHMRATMVLSSQPQVVAHPDCSPVAETVVTTVSGMKYDIKRLSDALSRHDEVVLEIRDAIRELAADKPFMCNARPPSPDDVVHLGSLLSMKVERIPQIMDLVFHPKDGMNLSKLELAVATYIFSRDLPHMYITLPTGARFPTRLVHRQGHDMNLMGALLTLVPQCEVVDDVLNVVVRMLTTTSERQRWFLPTSIMQAAIDDRSMTFGNMTSLHNKYMRSKVDRVTRIYQPMWCDRHWYLMIIDVPRKKLIYLDSLRDPHQADARKTGMMRVALYLEGLTLGKPWLSGEGALRPRFSAFDFEEPDVPQQKGNSMDCGVWVAQWMIREHLWKDYGVQHVNSATRMRLAADLVLKSHNEIAQEVVAKAFAHWEMKST